MASSGIFLAFPSAYLSISAENERLAPRPIYLSLEIPSAFEVPALSPGKKRNPGSGESTGRPAAAPGNGGGAAATPAAKARKGREIRYPPEYSLPFRWHN